MAGPSVNGSCDLPGQVHFLLQYTLVRVACIRVRDTYRLYGMFPCFFTFMVRFTVAYCPVNSNR